MYLVDLERALSIPMSQRAKSKLSKLEAKQSIAHENKRDLEIMMIFAFRYAVNRHFTEAMLRGNIDKIIIDNINLIEDDFLSQMICDIHREYQWWEDLKDKNDAFSANPHYLDGLLEALQKEYEKRGNKRIDTNICF